MRHYTETEQCEISVEETGIEFYDQRTRISIKPRYMRAYFMSITLYIYQNGKIVSRVWLPHATEPIETEIMPTQGVFSVNDT